MVRYGWLREGWRYGSEWWKNLVKIRQEIDTEVGNWIDDNHRRVVGNGLILLFGWTYGWAEFLYVEADVNCMRGRSGWEVLCFAS